VGQREYFAIMVVGQKQTMPIINAGVQTTKTNRDVTKFEFEFDNVRT